MHNIGGYQGIERFIASGQPYHTQHIQPILQKQQLSQVLDGSIAGVEENTKGTNQAIMERISKSHKEDIMKLAESISPQPNQKSKKNYHSEQWENNYRILIKFYKREGHTQVLEQHIEDGRKLGVWLIYQRQRKKIGKLTKNYERRLEDVGVMWEIFSERWEINYRLLVKFQKREGHANVPQRHTEENVKLGMWLKKQRQRKKIGKLDKGSEKKLEDIGVVWNIFFNEWESKYQLLLKFLKREGHSYVPLTHNEDSIMLGRWLEYQRILKKEKKLDKNFERKLEDVGVL